MCGIIAYIGHREAYPILIDGLKRMEYKGYDSAGLALADKALKCHKTKGSVSELSKLLSSDEQQGNIGMADRKSVV